MTRGEKRAMGFEPTTSALGRLHSATELRPQQCFFAGKHINRPSEIVPGILSSPNLPSEDRSIIRTFDVGKVNSGRRGRPIICCTPKNRPPLPELGGMVAGVVAERSAPQFY